MKVTINFDGDLKMGTYWRQFTTEDVFEFIRYTKAGLCLLRDKFGREVSLAKRNVEFPMHEDTGERCCVNHLNGEGQCMRCRKCHAWVKPSDWNKPCPGVAI